MSRLHLTMACWDYDRTRPLLDGSIQPEGIELTSIVLPPDEAFPRMLRSQEFDISEMSLAAYVMLKARGDCPFVAIPAFPSRIFRHSCIFINTNAGIKRPQDLNGKRIGVPEYQMTAAVFGRGMLHHEYGVAPESVEWLWGGQEEPRDTRPISYEVPERIRLNPIPSGKTLSEMLVEGELDALISVKFPAPFLLESPKVERLFPNFKEVELDYFRRTGIFPIMHTVIIREDIYAEHPLVAVSIYKALEQAKEKAYQELHEMIALKTTLPWLLHEVEETQRVMGKDFWAYGVEPNRITLEALAQYLVEQGLARRAPSPEELFILS